MKILQQKNLLLRRPQPTTLKERLTKMQNLRLLKMVVVRHLRMRKQLRVMLQSLLKLVVIMLKKMVKRARMEKRRKIWSLRNLKLPRGLRPILTS